jgi:hypothetical protein
MLMYLYWVSHYNLINASTTYTWYESWKTSLHHIYCSLGTCTIRHSWMKLPIGWNYSSTSSVNFLFSLSLMVPFRTFAFTSNTLITFWMYTLEKWSTSPLCTLMSWRIPLFTVMLVCTWYKESATTQPMWPWFHPKVTSTSPLTYLMCGINQIHDGYVQWLFQLVCVTIQINTVH